MAIILPGGFNITNNDPVDARITVADQTARLSFSIANVYEGLVVFQRDTNQLYVLTDSLNPGDNISWALISAAQEGAALAGIAAGNGLTGGGSSGNVNVSLDTGSNHFITGVIDLNIFQDMGSYYSTTNELQVTGSLTLRKDESGDALSIYNGDTKTFGISNEGIILMATQSATPTVQKGGMYLDENYNLFIGQE
jgi:hypothetical protein